MRPSGCLRGVNLRRDALSGSTPASLLHRVHDPCAGSTRAHGVRAILDVCRLTPATSNTAGALVDLDDLELILWTVQITRSTGVKLPKGRSATRQSHEEESQEVRAHVDASQITSDAQPNKSSEPRSSA